ncbi:MAG TPA: hypothetical protein VF006_27080 [Longimicrobium sp.]
MNGNATAHPRFLPQLDPTKSPPAASSANAGWTEHGNGVITLAKYSSALVVAGRDTPPERLKSIPSPWSRLLLFEQALFQREHPAHAQVLAEWRGLLGCLGLSDYLNLQMAATPVDFDGAAGPMQVLRSMVPSGDAAALWDHHVLLSIGGRLMGGTSPRTLVFTGIRASAPPSVPFQRNSRLADPTAHYSEAQDGETLLVIERWLARLGDWLKEAEGPLNGFLGLQPAAASSEPVSRAELVKKLLSEWHADTLKALDAAGPVAAPDVSFGKSRLISNAFPDRHPAREIFGALRFARVSHPEPRRSDLRLRDGEKVFNPGLRGVLLRDDNPYTGQIQLPAGQHGSVKAGRFQLALSSEQLGDPNAPDLGTFFEPKLIEVTGDAGEQVNVLQVDGKRYLYPFRADILAHLHPDAVVSYTRAAGDQATGIRVRLDIPLHNDLVLRYERDYLTQDIVSGITLPNLAVWPNFRARGWTHHFWFTQALQRRDLAVMPLGDGLEPPRTSSDGSMVWGRLAEPVQAWRGRTGDAEGLLLALPLPSVDAKGDLWDVAVDFGSTHTRVFRATEQVAGKSKPAVVDLRPRSVMLLGTSASVADSFFPALPGSGAVGGMLGSTQEPRSLIRLPMGAAGVNAQGPWLPPDGVIYWGSLLHEQPSGLRANLKWHRNDSTDLPAFHSYISQLYLGIAAEAAAAGASVRSVVTAYPTVFPEPLRHTHEQQWLTLRKRFEVEVKPPVSEAVALASYLVDERDATAGTNLLAVDIGGSTSDLAVWSGGNRSMGESVRLAGDVLSRLLAVDSLAREAISDAAAAEPILTQLPWREDGGLENGLIFNALLREVAQKDPAHSTLILAKNMYHEDSPGERVIAHAAYLYAAVSFLLGLMVRRQGATDRYEIHFAGHGSEFLRWLDLMEDNASTELPAVFFCAGLGCARQDVDVDVRLPGADVKQEVGRGLLAPRVGPTTAPRHRVTFVGESGYFGDGDDSWNTELGVQALKAFQPPSQPLPFERLQHITRFVEVFSTASVAASFGRALGITPERLDLKLRDRIHDRLFGPQSAWWAARAGGGSDHSMLEPFFVVEAKALLEHVTGNTSLFSL